MLLQMLTASLFYRYLNPQRVEQTATRTTSQKSNAMSLISHLLQIDAFVQKP